MHISMRMDRYARIIEYVMLLWGTNSRRMRLLTYNIDIIRIYTTQIGAFRQIDLISKDIEESESIQDSNDMKSQF